MDCKEARPLVDASVDRELSPADEWRMREHLATCADCRKAAAAARTLSQAVRGTTYHRAPAGLAASIMAALPAVAETESPQPGLVYEPARRRPRAWWRGLLRPRSAGDGKLRGQPGPGTGVWAPAAGWYAAALLALCAIGAAVVLNLRGPAGAGAGSFVDELVSSHVRAQISGRDLDVESSDRHTVKPWFNGRIDYAPPVEDLKEEGFPLVGGRLDYVGRERVAVLVYHYRKHVIDVYVFPPNAPAPAAATPPATRDGYALARWEHDGMTWWAVTDGGADVLAAFRTALDARLGSG